MSNRIVAAEVRRYTTLGKAGMMPRNGAALAIGSDESGIGLPHSKTLPRWTAGYSFREVLECGSPMPL